MHFLRAFVFFLLLAGRLAYCAPPLVSIVIPAHNEAESLPLLIDEIKAMEAGQQFRFEIVIVDDSSSDDTPGVLRRLKETTPELTSIRTERQMGKAPALRMGFRAAQGDLIVMMDADLQNNPADVPALLSALDDTKVDFVNGRRRFRNDTWTRQLQSKAGNWLRRFMLGSQTRDMGSGLKAFRRRLLPAFLSPETENFEGLHRYMPELAAMYEGKVVEVPIEDRPRRFGEAHYGFGRGLKLWGQIRTVQGIAKARAKCGDGLRKIP